jgi:uncharacterized Ntn-hydrolase superfamily protein
MLRTGTYSIVARDPGTGQLGVAVQSHWFSVGPIVPWARADVGAVATQSIAEPAYGPRALDLLAAGEGAQAALDVLLADDELAPYRQVAVIGADGEVAVHTGEGCVAHAGHQTGADYSVQANMMASAAVWPAMGEGFEAASGPLARRLLAALRAAETEGGDARGRQSAAIRVVGPGAKPWEHVADLRVEDHPEPLDELERLLVLADAYALATEGDELAGEGRHQEAGERYRRASELAPANHELLFWAGLAAAQAGELELGLERVREAIRLQPGWAQLIERLDPAIAPSAATVREALSAQA